MLLKGGLFFLVLSLDEQGLWDGFLLTLILLSRVLLYCYSFSVRNTTCFLYFFLCKNKIKFRLKNKGLNENCTSVILNVFGLQKSFQ